MFTGSFAHYLTYGATDQLTMRELAKAFDGLVVPGTVAAFQRDGTGGFVLTLSATMSAPDYVIDPRFPLFQQGLSSPPKKSHLALAQIFGYPSLIGTEAPRPESFDENVLQTVAEGWAKFNLGYTEKASKKFSKYERRLKQSIVPDDKKAPRFVLPPYFVVEGAKDKWWQLSKSLFDKTRSALDDRVESVRVIACQSAYYLDQLIDDVQDKHLVIWVSGLHEFDASAEELGAYLKGLQAGQKRGASCFALYGGFFSVIASCCGLRGSCHGIGFGEHRDWIELPRSGPPPARYYLPQIHRYISQELAYRLWRADRRLAECECRECNGKSPIELDYHQLMKHSVWCRAKEIEEWVGRNWKEIDRDLGLEETSFRLWLRESNFEEDEKEKVLAYLGHFPKWRRALQLAFEEKGEGAAKQ